MAWKINWCRIVGVIGTLCGCAGIMTAGLWYGSSKQIPVYDRNGNCIANLFVENGELQYECVEEYEAYVDIVRKEFVDVVKERLEEKTVVETAESGSFEIRTGFSEKTMAALSEAYENNADLMIGNSAAAVSDIKGCMTACLSRSSAGENYNYVNIPAYAGSAIKPLSVYTPALEDSTVTWSSMYRDSAYAMVEDGNGKMTEWPANTEPYTDQMITIEEAVAESNNAVAVKVLKDNGAEKSCQFLEDAFGISTDQETEIMKEEGEDRILGNIALGFLEGGVTVQQMTGAYQIFANGGAYYEPHAITEIRDDGNVYYTPSGEGTQVISRETAYIMNRLMRGVVLNGTGTSAQIEGVDVCGKTGTSEYGDHWFAGITPEYVCVVWHEAENEESSTDRSVQVFHDTVTALESEKGMEYPQPDSVNEIPYCEKSGLLRNMSCQNISTGYYTADNMPEICNKCR